MKLPGIFILIAIMTLSSSALSAAEWFDPTTHETGIQVDFSATGLMPLGDFSDIYQGGLGMMLDLSYIPEQKQDYRISFRTGYIYMLPEEETEDGYDTGMSSGFIIPLLFNYEYRFRFPFIDRMKIAPSVSAGMSINRAVYDDRSGTISGGVPTGHAAVKDQSAVSIEPMFLAGLNLMYMISWTDSVFFKSEAGMIYETETPMYFELFSAGYEKRF